MKHTIELLKDGSYLIDDGAEHICYSFSFGHEGWYRKTQHTGMFPSIVDDFGALLYDTLIELDLGDA